ncbi:hypothetical protein AAW12_08800 [Sphingobacterium sp. Ag1]|uniref:hypothetical protein n=1 Tax=Sphingobacterium sp. Ag1 TaxID=1643451 RepID=UPI000627B9A3|nr:hypothetical protein [Sphingobacterium sp. Ag1]KKO91750.1 hypothetical protein AAW12_08800 [Sphingobacterium sp. Ag1]
MKTLQQYYNEAGEYGRKLYLRNEAIRTGKWDMYESTVKEEFPDIADAELEESRELAKGIKQMSKQEFREWITKNRVNMLTSDLYVLDEGAILTGSVVPPGDLQFIIGDGIEDLIQCNVSPNDVLKLTNHSVYWVDPIVKA